MTDALLIHIGDCKAGSTSIQTVLRDGSWSAPGETRGAGPRPLRYAATGRDDGLNHHMLSNSLFIEGLAERRPLMHKALASEAAESGSPLLVLSSERYECGAAGLGLVAAGQAGAVRRLAGGVPRRDAGRGAVPLRAAAAGLAGGVRGPAGGAADDPRPADRRLRGA